MSTLEKNVDVKVQKTPIKMGILSNVNCMLLVDVKNVIEEKYSEKKQAYKR